jgi:hypothetical protein
MALTPPLTRVASVHARRELNVKLNIKAFALTCGILWGLGLFFLTWWIIAFDGSGNSPMLLGRIYRGYSLSPIGSVVGLVWAFFDGLVGGAVFAWVYNRFAGSLGTT